MPRYNPTAFQFLIQSLEERKFSNQCLEWPFYRNAYGYGVMSVKGSRRIVSRVSFEYLNGPIPEGMCVLHHCDNPSCYNPHHLFLGTRADNSHDMMSKGRHRPKKDKDYGEFHPGHKLTNLDVQVIRSVYRYGRKRTLATYLARLFHVHRDEIRNVAIGKNWKHLPLVK